MLGTNERAAATLWAETRRANAWQRFQGSGLNTFVGWALALTPTFVWVWLRLSQLA